MSLYRDARSKFWRFDFQIQGYRFSGSTKCQSKRDAEKIEAAEKAKAGILVDRLIRTAAGPMTIEAACTRWWNEHGRHLADPALKGRLDWLVAQIGPRTPLHAISDDTVSRLVEQRKLDVRRAGCDQDGAQLYRPITANTVNKTTIVLLRRVLRRARDNWDAAILREPVWKKHVLKETRRPVRELSAAEDLLLDAIESPDFIALRRFAEITGLRRRNLLLTWPQVDFELGVIRVVTKGGVPRTLPLTKEAYAILWAQRGNHPQAVFTYVARKTRKIPKAGVERIKGSRYPITLSGMASNKRNWKGAGVDARIHDLRHTAAMRTLRATGNLRLVQKLLGHTDIAITARFYTDATLEDLRSAMELTAQALPVAPPMLEFKKTEGGEP
jgi:integrase